MDMLSHRLATISFRILLGVAFQCEGIVTPPIGRQYIQFIFLHIQTNEAERIGQIDLVGVVALDEQRVSGKAARELDGSA